MGLVVVKIVGSRLEAEMLVSLLENEGIRAVVQSEDLGGLRPDLTFSAGGARILVDHASIRRAQQILENLEQTKGSP